MFGRLVAAALVLAASGPAASQPQPDSAQAQWVEQCQDWDAWDKAGPPFQIYGNTWYVGTCGISAILIAGDDGHVLIDGGPANAAGIIAANIQALGFRLADVKLLLHSHEHHDHIGGLAELQRLTGARLLASPAAAPTLASGTASPDDPQFAERNTFPAARIEGEVKDGEAVRLGTLALTPIATPGHTAGALSWQWQACARAGCHTVVYADSLTAVSSNGYRFSDHPDVVEAFRSSIVKIAELDCSILLTPHPSASGMRERLTKRELAYTPTCADYAAGLEVRLDERLFEESGPE